jgi:hypothetical protein
MATPLTTEAVMPTYPIHPRLDALFDEEIDGMGPSFRNDFAADVEPQVAVVLDHDDDGEILEILDDRGQEDPFHEVARPILVGLIAGSTIVLAFACVVYRLELLQGLQGWLAWTGARTVRGLQVARSGLSLAASILLRALHVAVALAIHWLLFVGLARAARKALRVLASTGEAFALGSPGPSRCGYPMQGGWPCRIPVSRPGERCCGHGGPG